MELNATCTATHLNRYGFAQAHARLVGPISLVWHRNLCGPTGDAIEAPTLTDMRSAVLTTAPLVYVYYLPLSDCYAYTRLMSRDATVGLFLNKFVGVVAVGLG